MNKNPFSFFTFSFSSFVSFIVRTMEIIQILIDGVKSVKTEQRPSAAAAQSKHKILSSQQHRTELDIDIYPSQFVGSCLNNPLNESIW